MYLGNESWLHLMAYGFVFKFDFLQFQSSIESYGVTQSRQTGVSPLLFFQCRPQSALVRDGSA